MSYTDLAATIGVTRQALSMLFKKRGEGEGKNGGLKPDIVRKFLLEKGHSFEKRAIAFQIVKGGVGKTSLAYHFGLRAAAYGYKVLFADFDHQANLTYALSGHKKRKTWIDIISTNDPIETFIEVISPNVDLLPASIRDADINSELQRKTRNLSKVIRDRFDSLNDKYDLIVCDCPPALGPIVTAVYLAVDTILAPVAPDSFSIEAVEKMIDTWGQASKEYEHDARLRIIINRFDSRAKTHLEQLSQIYATHSEMICPVTVRASLEMQTAINNRSTVFSGRSIPVAVDLDSIVRTELGLTKLQSDGVCNAKCN